MKNVNFTRLKECMKKAELGKELTIGFIGGAITQGSNAAKEECTYAYRVFEWWKETFPQATFHYVNAGIGGSSSYDGVARAEKDLLMYQPDFVVVDFSVNDDQNEFYEETFEGLIRKLLFWESRPAVLILNNVFYDTGVNAQEYHNVIGNWYQVPHVSMKNTIYQRMQIGEFTREDVTEDGLHPNDRGHELIAEEIIKFLKMVRISKNELEYESSLPVAKTMDAYEEAKRLTIREIAPKLDGFSVDSQEKNGHLDLFKNGWIGKKKGDAITFELKGTCIAVQYRKTIQKPSCVARVILDDDRENPVILDENSEDNKGECLYLQPVLHHGEDSAHRLEIEIISEDAENLTPFYLASVILA